MSKLITIIAALLVVAGGAWLYFSYAPAQPGTEEPGVSYYTSEGYGYTVAYPSTLQVKEYQPEYVTIGHISGTGDEEFVDGVAEIRTEVIEGSPEQSFSEAIAERLEMLCAADGPNESFSCTGVERSNPFATASGISGTELYLVGELKNLKTGSTTAISKGPYYVFVLATGATATRALVIHAPLNQPAAEADAGVIEAVAKSLTLSANIKEGGRYMDIETFVRTNISAISPVEATLGGTFYVTDIETHGGTGTVSYEDGHNAYTADFSYKVSQDGKPTITSFTVRH